MKLPDEKEMRFHAREAEAMAKNLKAAAEQTRAEMEEADRLFTAAKHRYHEASYALMRANEKTEAINAAGRVLRWPAERLQDLLVTCSREFAPPWAVKARAASRKTWGPPTWRSEIVAARAWIQRWQEENP